MFTTIMIRASRLRVLVRQSGLCCR